MQPHGGRVVAEDETAGSRREGVGAVGSQDADRHVGTSARGICRNKGLVSVSPVSALASRASVVGGAALESAERRDMLMMLAAAVYDVLMA